MRCSLILVSMLICQPCTIEYDFYQPLVMPLSRPPLLRPPALVPAHRCACRRRRNYRCAPRPSDALRRICGAAAFSMPHPPLGIRFLDAHGPEVTALAADHGCCCVSLLAASSCGSPASPPPHRSLLLRAGSVFLRRASLQFASRFPKSKPPK